MWRAHQIILVLHESRWRDRTLTEPGILIAASMNLLRAVQVLLILGRRLILYAANIAALLKYLALGVSLLLVADPLGVELVLHELVVRPVRLRPGW